MGGRILGLPMRIIQHTANALTLKERLLGVWFLAACMAAIGLFIFIGYESPVDWFGGGCIAIASVIGCLSPSATCTFDKQQQRVTLKRRRLLSQSIKRHAIAQIAAVHVERRVIVGTYFYSISLVLVSGQRLTLTQFPSTDWGQQAHFASKIRRFLQGELSQPPIRNIGGFPVDSL